jgi:hypothetical protein
LIIVRREKVLFRLWALLGSKKTGPASQKKNEKKGKEEEWKEKGSLPAQHTQAEIILGMFGEALIVC